jgi:hypothetical protein
MRASTQGRIAAVAPEVYSKGRWQTAPRADRGGRRGSNLLCRQRHPELVEQEGDVVGRLVDADRQRAADVVAGHDVDGQIDRATRRRGRLRGKGLPEQFAVAPEGAQVA